VIGKAIHARLKAHAGTTALVESRIYPMRLPQGPTYPAVRYQVIGAPREYVMGGATGDVHARVQVDCYAETYEGAKAVAEQVRLALSFFAGTSGGIVVERIFVDDERDMDEPQLVHEGEQGVYRVMQDHIAHYAEAVA
jgi:hypothetical protein